jgi:hypothetical protein
MSGIADTFATIALQSDQLGKNPLLKNIIFSNITLQATGKVGFSVKADVDQSLILYSNSYAANGTGNDPLSISYCLTSTPFNNLCGNLFSHYFLSASPSRFS